MPKEPNTLRGRLATFLKVGLAAAVITWLVRSGRLDAAQLGRALPQWPRLVAIGVLFYLQIAIMAWRWQGLATALGAAMSGARAFSLTMIGMLFNICIPGAVSGDLMKAYYASGGREEAGGYAASILVDRVVGLFSLITVAVCGAAWNARSLAGSSLVSGVWKILAGILAGAALGFVCVILASARVARMIRSVRGPVPLRRELAGFLDAMAAYRQKPFSLLAAFLLSLPCHAMACAAFYIALGAVSPVPAPLSVVLFIVPVGLTTLVVPLTPAGIGVGQTAFYALFEYGCRGHGKLGSAAFTLYQLILVLVSLSGAFFYVRYSRGAPHAPTDTDREGERVAAS